MNIFCLEPGDNPHGVDFVASAQAVDDTRVSRTLVLVTQVLSMCMWHLGERGPMKPAYGHHKLAHWVWRSRDNFDATALYADTLAREYATRCGYPTPFSHPSYEHVMRCVELSKRPAVIFRLDGPSEPPKLVPLQFQHLPLVEAYRAAWRVKKPLRYERCAPPDWLKVQEVS